MENEQQPSQSSRKAEYLAAVEINAAAKGIKISPDLRSALDLICDGMATIDIALLQVEAHPELKEDYLERIAELEREIARLLANPV